MKKYFYLMVLALVSMCFTACGDDNDVDNGGGVSSSLDGIWYLKTEKWYDWKDGKADVSDPYIKNHDDQTFVWTFAKTGSDYTITESRNGNVRDIWSSVGTNEYRNDNGTGRDRVVIKSASDKTMEVELYDGYYGEGYETGKTREYGILTFTR
jgi:hypothetical protein